MRRQYLYQYRAPTSSMTVDIADEYVSIMTWHRHMRQRHSERQRETETHTDYIKKSHRNRRSDTTTERTVDWRTGQWSTTSHHGTHPCDSQCHQLERNQTHDEWHENAWFLSNHSFHSTNHWPGSKPHQQEVSPHIILSKLTSPNTSVKSLRYTSYMLHIFTYATHIHIRYTYSHAPWRTS